MNKLLKTLVGTVFLASAMSSAMAANWYVSPTGTGDGKSIGSPSTVALVNVAGTLLPGDTVYMLSGKYKPFNLVVGGTSEATRVTWTAAPGNTPEVMNSFAFDPVSATTNGAMDVRASYITIDGITLTGNNLDPSISVAEDTTQTLTTTTQSVNPQNPTGPTIGPGGNVKYNNTGIRLSNSGKADTAQFHHLTVRNCLIQYFGERGVDIIWSDYLVFEYNKVYNNAWYGYFQGGGGMAFQPYNADAAPGYHNVIRGNTYWNNRHLIARKFCTQGRICNGDGIYYYGYKITPSATNAYGQYSGSTLITDNLFVFNGAAGIAATNAGTGAGTGGYNADVINNTFYMNQDNVFVSGTPPNGINGPGDIFSKYGTGNNFRNNIVYSKDGYKAQTSGGGLDLNVTFDYNLYYNNTISLTATGGGQLSATKSAHDFYANPQFINPTVDPATWNFRLKPTSPAIDGGLTIAGVTSVLDFDKAKRPRGASIDQGAFEFFSVPTSTPAITSANSQLGFVGTSLSYKATATQSPDFFAASGLPPGLTFNNSTGEISGTPTAAGTYSVPISGLNDIGTGTAQKTTFLILPSVPVLPAGFNSVLFGDGSTTNELTGAATNGTWIVKGRSQKIGGVSDSFISGLQSWTGDVVITAKFVSATNALADALSGITIRDNTNNDSRSASVLVSPTTGVVFTRRYQDTYRTVITAGTTQKDNIWLRLKRIGNVVSSYSSVDGVVWTLIRTDTIAFNNTVLVGLVTSSSGTSSVNTATFTNVTFSAK